MADALNCRASEPATGARARRAPDSGRATRSRTVLAHEPHNTMVREYERLKMAVAAASSSIEDDDDDDRR